MNENNLKSISIENLSILTKKADEFIDELEKLCEKYANEKDFSFKYEYEE